MNELKIIGSKESTISSLEVAEMIGKEHRHLLRDIREYISNLAETKNGHSDFFISSDYYDKNNQKRPCFEITKKGCEFVAHKLTGTKGAQFTATYIDRFHEMEKEINMQFSELSPQLQLLINIERRQNQHEIELKSVKQEVEGIREVVALNPIEWRKETSAMINKIAKAQNGTESFRDIRNESYELLEKRFGVSLGTRLKNKKQRMANSGICHSKQEKQSFLDVIQEDKKLIEGYVAIVKEMAIKYGGHQWVK